MCKSLLRATRSLPLLWGADQHPRAGSVPHRVGPRLVSFTSATKLETESELGTDGQPELMCVKPRKLKAVCEARGAFGKCNPMNYRRCRSFQRPFNPPVNCALLPSFIYRFVILPDAESSKVSLGHEMRPPFFPRHWPAESKVNMD